MVEAAVHENGQPSGALKTIRRFCCLSVLRTFLVGSDICGVGASRHHTELPFACHSVFGGGGVI